jgi:hypothetical protein
MTGIVDFFDRNEVESSIRRIDELLSCGIFAPGNAGNVLFRAAFIELLIALRDLMYKAEKYVSRVAFADDVLATDQIHDVSALIKYVRDALCHPDSDNHYIEKGNIKSTFDACFGRGVLLKTPDFEQSSPYADDICFFFGSQRILLKRHIVRAFEEAKGKLIPLLQAR